MLKVIFIFTVWTTGGAWAAPDDDDASARRGEASTTDEASDEDTDEVVVVTATRTPTRLSDAVVATEVIDREDIEASGAGTLDQLLETVPGLQLLDGFRGPGLSLRGHDPRHTLVLVDGRRTIGRVGGALDLRRFPVDRIERIEIVRGPTSAIHGADALGGVIQIITRGAEDDGFAEATLTGGGYVGDTPLDDRAVVASAAGPAAGLDHLAVDASGGFRAGNVEGRAGLSAQGWDGWDRAPDIPGTGGDRLRSLAPTVGLVWRPGAHRLTLDLDGLISEGQGIDGAATGAVTDRLHLTESWDGAIGGAFALPRGLTLDLRFELSAYRDQLRQDQRFSDALDSYEQTRQLLGRAVAQVDGWVDTGRRHHLQGGVEAMLESVRADRLDPPEIGRQRGAVFAQHTWRILDRPGLTLLYGARLELDSRFGVFPAPRAALRIDPHRTISIRVAGGGGFRAPDVRQLYLSFANPGVGYVVRGNPDLRPERSWGGTVDVELRPHPLFHTTLSAWHDQLYDLITTDVVEAVPGETRFGYLNVGRGRVQGASVALELAPAEVVSASLAYTYTDADDLDLARPLSGRAEHSGTASVRLREQRSGVRAQVSATVLGPRPFYPTDDPQLAELTPVTTLLDARVSWEATRHLELFAGVDNALDDGRTVYDATRPRRVYGGLTVRFATSSRTPGADS